jgi:hypothetical protein
VCWLAQRIAKAGNHWLRSFCACQVKPMKQCTLFFVLDEGEKRILLGYKKRGCVTRALKTTFDR